MASLHANVLGKTRATVFCVWRDAQKVSDGAAPSVVGRHGGGFDSERRGNEWLEILSNVSPVERQRFGRQLERRLARVRLELFLKPPSCVAQEGRQTCPWAHPFGFTARLLWPLARKPKLFGGSRADPRRVTPMIPDTVSFR